MQVLILAGGKGTRLKGVVRDRPKPMAEVHGRPFLSWLLDYFISEGATRFVFSIGYMHKIIEDYYGDGYHDIPIVYAVEKEPLGTGGGILLGAMKIEGDEPFLISNGDSFLGAPLAKLFELHKNKNADMTIALLKMRGSDRYGSVDVDAEGKILSFKEKEKTDNEIQINGGLYLTSKPFLKELGFAINHRVSMEEEIFPKIITEQKRLYGVTFADIPFIDIGIPEDYHCAFDVISKAMDK